MPPTLGLDNNAALPREVVRVKQLPQGLELYFPALRNPGAAAGFGAFGALSIALPLLAMAGVSVADGPAITGWLAIILVAGFALPILVFGFVFLALSAYLLGNSLEVRVERDSIAVSRRLFGLTLSRRSLACADISAVEPQVPSHLQNRFSAEPRYRLVARSRNLGHAVLVVAESLPGRRAMERMAALIEAATGIGIKERLKQAD